jgi:hypothetical protein
LAAFFGFTYFFLTVAVAGVAVAMAGAAAKSTAPASFPIRRISAGEFLEGICAPVAGGAMVF